MNLDNHMPKTTHENPNLPSAPPPGSEVRCNPALNHTIRRVHQPDPFEPVECFCQKCGKQWREVYRLPDITGRLIGIGYHADSELQRMMGEPTVLPPNAAGEPQPRKPRT
jgi:hypothetical protein